MSGATYPVRYHSRDARRGRRTVSVALAVVALLVLAGARGRPDLTRKPDLTRQRGASTSEPARYVVLDSAVRAALEAQWDDSTATQSERAYCLAYVRHYRADWGEVVYRVIGAQRAAAESAGHSHVSYYCPRSRSSWGGIATLHTHPPSTCSGADTEDEPCVLGGDDAYQCTPSRRDEESTRLSGRAFGLVQCDRHAFVAYGLAGAGS